MSCQPSYPYTPSFTPRAQPSLGPDFNPGGDCSMGVFNKRRSRAYGGNIFIRSIYQTLNANCLTFEVADTPISYILPIVDINYLYGFYRDYLIEYSEHFENLCDVNLPVISTSGSSIVVSGDATAFLQNATFIYLFNCGSSSGLARVYSYSYNNILNETVITSLNSLPNNAGLIGSVCCIYYANRYDVVDVNIAGTFILAGDQTLIFAANKGFRAKNFEDSVVDGEYIVNSAVYSGLTDTTTISVKTAENDPSLVPIPGLGTAMGILTDLHDITLYKVAYGEIITPVPPLPEDPIPPDVCSVNNREEIRLAVNATNPKIEILWRGVDVNYPPSPSDPTEDSLCLESFSERYLSGADTRPDLPETIPCVRAGPQRVLTYIASQEQYDGSIVSSSPSPEQWTGSAWVPYSNLVQGSCPPFSS